MLFPTMIRSIALTLTNAGRALEARQAFSSHRLAFPPTRFSCTRHVSSSPYGRTHVWKRRAPNLPPPVVPQFPQRVIRSDGSTFTHWTTSPRSVIRLTRDVTNNPLWNSATWAGAHGIEEEDAATGRLGRFQRRFEGSMNMDWMGVDGEYSGAGNDGRADDNTKGRSKR
jgi:hypothetical protein